jgi:4-amino-4-deoxy-L-arabinose transferase-like glycosyltransferase
MRTALAALERRPILLILLLALAIRAIHLDAPILGEHSWRQADTAAIARNYTESGYRILHPQIDWRGETSGEVESEFPLYPYMVALLYGAFGVAEAWGRGLSIVFSLLTLLFVYRLVRANIDEKVALWSAFLLAILPLNAFFGRAFMPEPLMLMASVAGIYYFFAWTRTDEIRHYALSALFVCIAVLVKLPALYLGAPLLYLALLRYGVGVLGSPRIWLYGALVLSPVGLWYWHAHQLLLETGLSFGIWDYGSDKWGNWDLVTSCKYWNRVLLTRLAHRHLTWFGFAIFLPGLFLKRQSREEWLFDVWLLGLLVYLAIVGVGNYAHNYYQLPLLLPAVVFMGKVLGRHFQRPVLGSPVRMALAGTLAALVVLSGDRVIAIGPDPTLLYLAHRKGWRSSMEELTPANVDARIRAGAAFLVGVHHRKGSSEAYVRRLRQLENRHEVVVSGDRYFILRMQGTGGGLLRAPASPAR